MDRDQYTQWIRANVEGSGYGACVTKAVEMAAAFPELEVRQGLYECPVWGPRQHRWCRVRGTDVIVDPTGAQFPTGSHFPDGLFYEDLTDASEDELLDRVPTGKCWECGGFTYRGQTFCDSGCEVAYRASLGL